MNNNEELDSKKLPWTGERYLPEIHGSIEIEHTHRYLLAKQLSSGKRILDIASGEGYGSAMLAETAKSVIGVDISQDAVSHAAAKYQANNLEFRLGSCSAIPVADNSIDMIISFETIEHHTEHDEMMREFKRVLAPNGFVIISSPDKYEYSDRSNYKNPYHVKELYRDEFEILLKTNFKNCKVLDQRVVYGSAIFGNDVSEKFTSYKMEGGKVSEAFLGLPAPLYLVAIVSDDNLPLIQNGFLEDDIELSDQIKSRDWQIINLNQNISERDQHIISLNQEANERNQRITNLDKHIANLGQEISNRDEHITSLNQAYDEQITALHNSVSWRITRPLRYISRLIRKILGN